MRCQVRQVVHRRHQVAEVGFLRQVVPVGLDGLAQERDLADAAVHQVRHFFDDLIHGPAGLAAAAVRHDAVGAELVAAVDHRHVGGRAGAVG